MRTLLNIFHLGIKELRGLGRDTLMLVLIVYSFSFQVYVAATGLPEAMHKAPIAIVDEDHSQLSTRIINAFYPPHFLPPAIIDYQAMDPGMDAGLYTFVLDIPPNFQRDVLAGRQPAIQLNIDATRMSQAFIGNSYIQNIINGEVADFVEGQRTVATLPVELEVRMRFNPNLTSTWFGSVMQVINSVTMLSIILTGAALIREREHGTLEHLLVMPLTPFEIMMSKVWSMGLVVVVVATASVIFVVQRALGVPIEGSIVLFVLGTALHLFATTSMGIFLGTVARSMPQMGLLMIIVLLPLQMLSGSTTPRESMPQLVQTIMLAAPTTHFVALAQAILYRGAGFGIVWPQFLALLGIGGVFFALALARFRRAIGSMA
ncbi:ABC transporter permease [Methylocaldum szegediense]|uniref:ABC transporter family protein YhhJ n=1 Tax=Methylocaldum szegediense TaxID=73780 RepID=A0ABN8X301_9GAMM|nr:ABC transporter permease [Methylocaldum szegediense]CAI8793311.1 ABC transporter family protein YhhJ [Methylocaldum szegediense]